MIDHETNCTYITLKGLTGNWPKATAISFRRIKPLKGLIEGEKTVNALHRKILRLGLALVYI